ncbi:MAG: peroxiredoxin [Candidatus Riflebacteria bacterium]|nr:peroxiredoxin [Candidatus Riflebacteria bacterium]
MSKKLAIGDKAPIFSGTDKKGKFITTEDFLGKKNLVLFFYYADGSPICTKEACAFRDTYSEFAVMGAILMGISSDSVESHRLFSDENHLPFILISDSTGGIQEMFGLSKTLGLIPERATFVIDKEGIIRHIFSSQLSAQRHVEEALRGLREIQNDEVIKLQKNNMG